MFFIRPHIIKLNVKLPLEKSSCVVLHELLTEAVHGASRTIICMVKYHMSMNMIFMVE